MINKICPTHTSQYTIFQGNDQDEAVTSSRYCINWDKVIVFANSALIVAGIAAGFFMKMPLLILGLGVYGTLYLLLKPLSDTQLEDEHLNALEGLNNLKDEVVKLEERKARINSEIRDARTIRRELNLSKQEQDTIAERSIKVARGRAAEEWVERESKIAERDNPELHRKLKELGKAMVEAGNKMA